MRTKLGQNFLINKKALETIARELEIKDDETIIEIGPGHGELTEEILARNKKITKQIQRKDGRVNLIAIEKDATLAQELRNKIYDLGIKNVEIVEGDALKVLPSLIRNPQSAISNFNYKIAGNIPYYITGYLLRILGELETKPSLAILTIQKEVAERLAAKPPKMNLLAAATQFWSKPEIISYLPKEYFKPEPEVDSAVVKFLIRNPQPAINPEDYYRFIKIIFKQPRKTILNNLSAGLNLPKEEISKIITGEKIPPADRPQNLNVEQILKLSEKLESIII
ncbi:MAG: 16S rRNA (adenine(1518)-N(6)/adenine(1519)-N(6))-dimethyltransferase RsmA [Patescibacteria group bacterium]|nr:16S rRNA (adenine(1518)-N(6)/adenine(1519)-N(6))-dimethyltransferase RsmA [Patescibacteria group bacterium]